MKNKQFRSKPFLFILANCGLKKLVFTLVRLVKSLWIDFAKKDMKSMEIIW